MSLDYYVLCEQRPEDADADWTRNGVADVVNLRIEEGDRVRELAAEHGVEANYAVGMNCHASAGEFVDELGRRLAEAFRGLVWCDHVTDNPLFEATDASPDAATGDSLDAVVDEWEQWARPRIDERNRAAEAKKARRQKLRDKARAGEDVGQWNWDLDVEEDDFDLDDF